MGDTEFREKLQSLQFNAAGPRKAQVKIDRDRDVKLVETYDQATGRTDGFETHHKTGRKDQEAFLDPCVILPKNES